MPLYIPFVKEQICKQLNEWKDEPVVCLETAILKPDVTRSAI